MDVISSGPTKVVTPLAECEAYYGPECPHYCDQCNLCALECQGPCPDWDPFCWIIGRSR